MSYRRDARLDELCVEVFASLRRVDQRTRATEYLRGLLRTPGRKSIRNIAAGGTATEQNLHHFVSDSTWDWAPVRRALVEYVTARSAPMAWVLAPMVIPKAGTQSVGVCRRFDPVVGQTRNAQQAVGVWLAGEESSHPVNWRLHLSPAWLADRDRRDRAAIPAEVEPETLGDCAVAAYREMTARPDLPLVLDARAMGALATVDRLRASGVPFLARIDPATPLTTTTLPGHDRDTVPAHWLMGAAKALRRPVPWTDHRAVPVDRTAVVAAVRVEDVVVLGVADVGDGWPAELWLTNLTTTSVPSLLRLSRLTGRVDRDLAEIADRVGIRDFSGRSFCGWHRHVTLASAAHVVLAMSPTRGQCSASPAPSRFPAVAHLRVTGRSTAR
jgi:SRSO17 transposase